MKKIKWESKGSSEYANAVVGNIKLHCSFNGAKGSRRRWFANVYFQNQSRIIKYGLKRKLLSKAKEDAVQIARKLLLDYYAAITKEMKNFDLCRFGVVYENLLC